MKGEWPSSFGKKETKRGKFIRTNESRGPRSNVRVRGEQPLELKGYRIIELGERMNSSTEDKVRRRDPVRLGMESGTVRSRELKDKKAGCVCEGRTRLGLEHSF